MLSKPRKILKRVHPEGIPGPGSILYNKISSFNVFQRHYQFIVHDISHYLDAGRILDVGTGPGWLLLKLNQLNRHFTVSGVDISESMIEMARKNIRNAGKSNEIEIYTASAADLPFADNSFDLVVSTGSAHHWKNATVCLNEIHRVLKPGKYSLIYDLVSDTPKTILKAMARDFGYLKMLLCWLHAYEEPFFSYKMMPEIAAPTLFQEGQTKFVGIMCCLILQKQA